MRDFKGMKRQRGRNRGGGGSGGGGKPQQNANRAFESNGPENMKVRGNAQHVFEKYQQLARDAQTSGDRVLAENYLQHAEHYFRLLRAMQPQRPASEILGRDQFVSGYDIDFEDETPQAIGEGESQSEGDAQPEGESRERWESRRDDRPRDDRPRDDRPPREEARRDDRPRAEREERPRVEREGRRDRWRERDRDRQERFDRQERGERTDPMAVVEPQATPLVTEERPAPMLRDAEGGESHAPAFPQSRPAAPAPAPEAEAPAPRPRRRRAPRSFEGAADAPPPTEQPEDA